MTFPWGRKSGPPLSCRAGAIRSLRPAGPSRSGAGAVLGLRLIAGMALCALLGAFAAGCSTHWYYSYAEAEQERLYDRQEGRPQRDLLDP